MLRRRNSGRRMSLPENVIVLAAFVLTGNLIAGVGINILFDGYASQARPRLAHQPVAGRTTIHADRTPKVPLSEAGETAGPGHCVATLPPY